MGALGWLWIGVSVLGVIDAMLHPPSDWAHADRDRPFWVTFMAMLGPIFVPIYLVAVRARFPRGGSPGKSA